MAFQGLLGFLGFGNMGHAIAQGVAATGAIPAHSILAYDIDPAKRESARAMGAGVAESPADLAARCACLLLAVKPQTMEEALEEIRGHLAAGALVLSIAAGISTEYLESRLGAGLRVIRVMPNTPAMVNAGAAAFALGAHCIPSDSEIARLIFNSVGMSEQVPESAIDAITALSGSGPAYFFYLVECMVKAAVELGLPEDQATRLAAQTCLGSGLLLTQSGEIPAVLRERVTSKGGTTFAALEQFRALGFEHMIREGVKAAAARSKELGK